MSEPTAPATTHAAPAAETHAADSHGHGHGDSIFVHAKPYIIVGVFLFVFTVITVGLSYIDFAEHRFPAWVFGKIGVTGMGINVVVGLLVATFKVSLVGWYFMHLKQEKRTIWRPLFFTFFFCLGLFLLTLMHFDDPIPTTSHPYAGKTEVPVQELR